MSGCQERRRTFPDLLVFAPLDFLASEMPVVSLLSEGTWGSSGKGNPCFLLGARLVRGRATTNASKKDFEKVLGPLGRVLEKKGGPACFGFFRKKGSEKGYQTGFF